MYEKKKIYPEDKVFFQGKENIRIRTLVLNS